jgi:shikimate kinase
MLIYLIGYMGSGKSSIGPRLARGLGYEFVDIDLTIEEKYKLSIRDFFQKYGEDRFRFVEHQTLIDSFKLENHIIATGGGTPCYFNNMELIKKYGLSVYLQLSIDALHDRLWQSRKPRPLVKDIEPVALRKQIADHLAIREKYYKMADLIVDANRPDTSYLVNILKHSITDSSV